MPFEINTATFKVYSLTNFRNLVKCTNFFTNFKTSDPEFSVCGRGVHWNNIQKSALSDKLSQLFKALMSKYGFKNTKHNVGNTWMADMHKIQYGGHCDLKVTYIILRTPAGAKQLERNTIEAYYSAYTNSPRCKFIVEMKAEQ